MHPKDRILKYLSKQKSATAKGLLELFGFSRQALHKHMKELIRTGEVLKHGTTRGAYYSSSKVAGEKRSILERPALPRTYRRRFGVVGLEEHKAFEEISLFLNLRKYVNKNTYAIFEYTFTEMLNNALEHSHSKDVGISVSVDPNGLRFAIRDYGIGVFHSIRERFKLPDEATTIGELIKGKITTMPKKHTGEGLFFTSKSADKMTLKSHRIDLLFDNLKKDLFVKEIRFLRGTEVAFAISNCSKRKLDNVFREYAPAEFDYKFEKTRVYVKLFAAEYVSRSEAKRLLTGLDKFSEIVLDLKGVRSIGQGFVDEIFRVFAGDHPHIKLKTENVSPTLMPMISHVVDNNN
jgi:anti-sigma regulatory factor (Ser/Thr protein kinase)